MLITSASLDAIRIGFKAIFMEEMKLAPSMWQGVAETVTSTRSGEKYGWLGEVAPVREWVGPRVVNSLKEFDYTILNKSYENTISVPREKIEDDELGTYNMRAKMQSRQVAQFDDRLVFNLLKTGFTANCYDGQFFFDADHPVLDENGVLTSQANTDGGAGAYWFLVADDAPMKPLIMQKRKEWEWVPLDKIDDPNVFMNKEFYYGVDGRRNAGFGLWQGIWGSRQPLTAASYSNARAVMGSRKGDYGLQLGFSQFTLHYAPALESDALKLLNSEYGTGGVTNEWKGTAKGNKVPWLA
jgi:phage major head subunit gpT-like protein